MKIESVKANQGKNETIFLNKENSVRIVFLNDTKYDGRIKIYDDNDLLVYENTIKKFETFTIPYRPEMKKIEFISSGSSILLVGFLEY